MDPQTEAMLPPAMKSLWAALEQIAVLSRGDPEFMSDLARTVTVCVCDAYRKDFTRVNPNEIVALIEALHAEFAATKPTLRIAEES